MKPPTPAVAANHRPDRQHLALSSATRRWPGVCCGWLLAAIPVSVCAADLSMLSDFGRPDIPQEMLGMGPGSGNVAGIEQSGDFNVASSQQFGPGHNAQIWQSGSDLGADVSQHGSDNQLRLSQEAGVGQRATLLQDGAGNQMALQQVGSNAALGGSQTGDGNQLVLQQQGNSQFLFTQSGSQNQIVVDLPAGMALQVEQTGNNLSFELHP